MSDPVLNYLLDIVRQTREHPLVLLGASPRASLSFMMACKAYAFLQGRDYVLPDDVKILTPFALGHRILLRPESRLDNISVESLLQKLLQSIHVPVTMRQ
jgi:MoxR-like ATPase